MNILEVPKRIAQDHIEYRQQIIKLAKSDLIRTYRRAALGWSWAFIKPAFTIFIYWFAFTIGLRSGGDVAGMPFFFWLVAGIIPWFYMSEMITQGSESINRYSYLVTKMKFPIATIPTFVSISKLFVHLLLLVATMLIFWIGGYPPTIYYLQLPFYMLCMFIFFTALALLMSPISSFSNDFTNLVRALITGIFWFSGVIWDVNNIKIVWLKRFLRINPVTYICNGFRNVFIYEKWFFEDMKTTWYFCGVFVAILIFAFIVYEKLRKEIPDVL